jgi:hypothetical protein
VEQQPDKTSKEQPVNPLSISPAQGAAIITALGALAAIITALAALTYVLGIVALWIPIARAYTGDYSTALYAASLVPRTVVIGQGVRSWFGPALYITILFSVLSVLWFSLGSFLQESFRKWWLPIWSSGVIVYMTLAALLAYELHLDLSPHKPWREMHGATLTWTIVSWALYFSGLAGVFAYAWRKEGGRDRLLRKPDREAIFHPKAWIAGLRYATLVFLVVMIASIPADAAKDPPLPTVAISGASEREMGGYLLAHSDATWYILNREGLLMAIPDDEIEAVRISPPND